MRRVAIVGSLALLAIAATSACGERWPAPTTPPAHTSIAPRLRVGVMPIVNDAKNVESGTAMLSILSGLVLAPHVTYTWEWTRPPLITFVHDVGRVFSMPLYDALRADPRFELVAFEPFDEASYDLVITGNIRRLGFARWMPFVPLPIFMGSLISALASSDVWATEIDVVVRAPLGGPVIRYGLQSTCIASEPNCTGSYSESFATAVRGGFASFVGQLDRYLDARDSTFWVAARQATRARYYHSLDPRLAPLEDEARAASDPRRAELQASIDTRYSMLDALWEIERFDEDAWAASSASRVEKEIATTNANAEAAQVALIHAMVVNAALSSLSVAQHGAGRDQRELVVAQTQQRAERARNALERKGNEVRTRIVRDALAAMEKAGADRRARRAAWLDHYRAVTEGKAAP